MFEFLIVHLPLKIALPRIISQNQSRFRSQFRPAVLHFAAIFAFIRRRFIFRGISLHQFVIIFHRTVAHLSGPLRILRFLSAVTLIHLGFQYLEFIQLGSFGIAYLPAHLSPELITGPEIRKLLDDGIYIPDSSPVISSIVQHQRTVEQRNHIIRFQLQHEIEVLDGTVVVAHLRPKQTTVEMTDIIGGVHFQCRIIVHVNYADDNAPMHG